MFKKLFKKEFMFKHSFKKDGVFFDLFDMKDKRYELPLSDEITEDLYKWDPSKHKVLSQLTTLSESLKDIDFSEKLISEFAGVYSEDDLEKPPFFFERGSLVIPYKLFLLSSLMV